MAEILTTNLNDRWARYAATVVEREQDRQDARRKRRPQSAPVPREPGCAGLPARGTQAGGISGQTDRSLALYEAVNSLPEPFTCSTLFKTATSRGVSIGYEAIQNWLSHRRRAGDVEVVQERAVGKRLTTYRRSRPVLEPRPTGRSPSELPIAHCQLPIDPEPTPLASNRQSAIENRKFPSLEPTAHPALTSRDALARLRLIARALRERTPWQKVNATTLASRLGVVTKTIYRDIHCLKSKLHHDIVWLDDECSWEYRTLPLLTYL